MAARSWLFTLVLVVIVVAAGAGGLAYYFWKTAPAAAPAPTIVAEGSNVTVNYIGVLGSGPDQGKIFDTSLYAIATNPAYPKALEYHPRGAVANYTPLAVYVGPSAPSGGYTLGNLSFTQVVTGFWQGIVGMAPNSTRTIVIPQALGYGADDPACELTVPLVETVPVLTTFAGITFQKDFPTITAAVGEVFTDPQFGWTDQILSANSSFVTIQRLPYVGETETLPGWPVTVTSIVASGNSTGGTITLQNELSASDAGRLLGDDYLGTGPCSSSSNGHEFIVSDVNLVDGTFTENFNPEVQGVTLIFTVTVVGYWPHK